MADSNKNRRRKVMRDLIRAAMSPTPIENVTALELEMRDYVTKTLGLTKHDASWFFNKLQRDHWRVFGVPVTDWKALADNYHRNRYFESQRGR